MSFMEEFQFVFCLTVLVLGFFGNLLVIITFSSKGARMKTYEILVISLAIGDFLGTFCFPLVTILHLKSDVSFLGDFGCQFINWLGTTSVTGSAFSLVAISIDRLMLVIRPHQNRPRPWKVSSMAFLIWIIASFPGIIYFFRIHYWPEHNMCRTTYKNEREDIAHTVSLFLIQMVFPIITMSVVYGAILYRLKSMAIRRLSTRSNSFEIRQKKNRKLTKLFLTLVIVFFVLTLPYNIFYIWYTLKGQTIQRNNSLTIKHVYHVLLLILLSNSCANPLIYAKLHKSFRRKILRIIFPCLMKPLPEQFDHSPRKTWLRSSSNRKSSTSSATKMSSAGPSSPCRSHGPFLPFDSEDHFSATASVDNCESANMLEPLPCDLAGSSMNGKCSPETLPIRVSHF